MDNLSEVYQDSKIYYNGDVIPKWGEYRFHFYKLVLTTSSSGVTHAQFPIFGHKFTFYNDNNQIGGTIGVSVSTEGKVQMGGSFPLTYVHIRDHIAFR